MCLQVMRWVGSAWVSWKMTKMLGRVEAVHRAVIAQERRAPAGRGGVLRSSALALPESPGRAPVLHEHWPCDLGIGGRSSGPAPTGRHAGRSTRPVHREHLRGGNARGWGAVRVVPGREPRPRRDPGPPLRPQKLRLKPARRQSGTVGTAVPWYRTCSTGRQHCSRRSGAARTAAAAVGVARASTWRGSGWGSVRARLLVPRPPSRAEPQRALLEEFRAWGRIYSSCHALLSSPQEADLHHLHRAPSGTEGFRGGCRWTTHPLTKTQHPQPCSLQREAEPGACTAGRTSPSMPGDIPDFPVMGDS